MGSARALSRNGCASPFRSRPAFPALSDAVPVSGSTEPFQPAAIRCLGSRSKGDANLVLETRCTASPLAVVARLLADISLTRIPWPDRFPLESLSIREESLSRTGALRSTRLQNEAAGKHACSKVVRAVSICHLSFETQAVNTFFRTFGKSTPAIENLFGA